MGIMYNYKNKVLTWFKLNIIFAHWSLVICRTMVYSEFKKRSRLVCKKWQSSISKLIRFVYQKSLRTQVYFTINLKFRLKPTKWLKKLVFKISVENYLPNQTYINWYKIWCIWNKKKKNSFARDQKYYCCFFLI